MLPFLQHSRWWKGSIKKNCVGLHCRLDGGAVSDCIIKTAVGAVVFWIMEHFHMCAIISLMSSSHLSRTGIWRLFLKSPPPTPCSSHATVSSPPPSNPHVSKYKEMRKYVYFQIVTYVAWPLAISGNHLEWLLVGIQRCRRSPPPTHRAPPI